MTEESGSKLWSILHEINDGSDRLKTHLAALQDGSAPPTDPEARRQLIESDINLLKKLAAEYTQAADELLAQYEVSPNN